MKPTIVTTPLPGAVVIEPAVRGDGRGLFFEAWNSREFAAAGLPTDFCQDNQSQSARGVIRGLHFQDEGVPMAKLVRCITGSIFDVIVDVRRGSPTFGRWFGLELSAENRKQLFVPVGFAHGLQALQDGSEVHYKQTGFYAPQAEITIVWNDPTLAIDWPLANPLVSSKDAQGKTFLEYARDPSFSFDVGT